MAQKIKFKGRIYFIPGGSIDEGGPIATKKQYENGLMSYAHLYPNGEIKRVGAIIGKREDIKLIGEEELKPTGKAFSNVFNRIFANL